MSNDQQNKTPSIATAPLLEGEVLSAKELTPSNERECEIFLAGKEEGLIQGVEIAIKTILPQVVAALTGEVEKKAAISDGLRHGSPECGKVMVTHYGDKNKLTH